MYISCALALASSYSCASRRPRSKRTLETTASNLVNTRITGTGGQVGHDYRLYIMRICLPVFKPRISSTPSPSFPSITSDAGTHILGRVSSVILRPSETKLLYQTACSLSDTELLASVRRKIKSRIFRRFCGPSAWDSNPEHSWNTR